MVDVSGPKAIVNVFHEAKEVFKQRASATPNETTVNAAFVPMALVPHTTDDGQHVLYVSRDRVGAETYGGGATAD